MIDKCHKINSWQNHCPFVPLLVKICTYHYAEEDKYTWQAGELGGQGGLRSDLRGHPRPKSWFYSFWRLTTSSYFKAFWGRSRVQPQLTSEAIQDPDLKFDILGRLSLQRQIANAIIHNTTEYFCKAFGTILPHANFWYAWNHNAPSLYIWKGLGTILPHTSF